MSITVLRVEHTRIIFLSKCMKEQTEWNQQVLYLNMTVIENHSDLQISNNNGEQEPAGSVGRKP